MTKYAIDPGHGNINNSLGGDGGAVGYLNEQDCALDIANRVITKLNALGHNAFNVRPNTASSVTNSLQKRCDSAASADYLISIHLNAGGGLGSEIYAMSDSGSKLAGKVLNELIGLGFRNRGVKDGSHLYVIRHSKPVAILVEVCFVDSKTDSDKYNSIGAERVANAIVKGLTGNNAPIAKEPIIKPVQPPKQGHSLDTYAYLQHELNIQCNAKLSEDNIPGSLTLNACVIIRKGATGNITKWIQNRLNKLGFNCGQADGIFGNGTASAVRAFQKSRGLLTDAIVGKNTWRKLLGL